MLKNIIKKIINVFGQVNDNPRRNVRRAMRRKLGFEVLEGRELLSAVGLDDNFYNDTFEDDETFYSNDYYESGSVSGYSETNTYDEFDQNQENTMSSGKDECNIFSLSGPTAINGILPKFSESSQDTFNVTINNESLSMDNICSDGDFQLIFGGTASTDDFAIYDGNNLISNDTTSWSNNTVFFYSIPVGATSVTLTFKIIDNQFLEPSTENLTISVGCVSSGGEMGGCVCMIDTISVTIINDSFSVEWQTIDGTDSNKATLSPDTVNQGQRVFPEKSTPNGAIENKFELVFKLETAATDSVTLYYKFFDPDNFIGLGNNDNNASSWTGGDNYATSSITTGSITIAAGATNKALTVVVYSDGYTGTKLTASATTIIIDTAHAGDNFIVVVDTDQAKTNVAALGTTEATRYKETHNYAQTELLTVWRTLWMELDQMAAPTVTATDGFALTDQGTTWDYTAPVNEPMNFDVLAQPVKPNITLLTAAMLTACIEVKEVSQDPENWIWIVDENDNLSNGGWRTETPFVHNLPNANVSTVTNIGSLSRDININTHEFWTIQAIGGYEAEIMKDYDAPNELSVFGYRAPRYANINPIGGVIMIFQETIRDFAVTGISANSTSCLRTSNQINQLVTLHETLHTFGFVDHNPNNPNINDGDIMNASTWLYSVDTDHVVKLNAEQIKKIQANTMIQ